MLLKLFVFFAFFRRENRSRDEKEFVPLNFASGRRVLWHPSVLTITILSFFHLFLILLSLINFSRNHQFSKSKKNCWDFTTFCCKILCCIIFRAGEINSRLSNDVQEFKSAFKHCISQGLRCSAQVNWFYI
jgi:hypothetical protein